MDRKANGSQLRNIIAATVIAAASAGGGYLVGNDSAPPSAPAIALEPEAPSVPTPSVAEITLARADIIRLANGAADATSGGPAVEDMMDGRRFVLRIPFGCEPLTEREVDQSAGYAVEDQTLRIRVVPEDWTDLPWVANELTQRDAIGAEGFWIPRPWTQGEACVPGESDLLDPSSSLGIAQLFDSESSRVGQRRGRALEATVQLGAGDPNLAKGLRLVLQGRVARWPGGRETVLCRAANAYDRPVCVVATKLDTISMENATTGERLADWRF